MKNVYFIVTLLFCLFAQGQNSPAIKIYLEDAETNQNIPDAKVTLEGFEIPAITGKYDKKEKCYYFAEIPAGYNTVMAYHKKYNEKGLQDKSKLPSELHLNLYNPLNVAIEFPHPIGYNDNDKDRTLKKYMNDYFVEDPYKIAINSHSVNNCKCIDSIIKSISLDIELIDVVKKINKATLGIDKFECDSSFVYGPASSGGGVIRIGGHEPRPLGKFSFNDDCIMGGDFILFLRKKDGGKFKRFNDPIIKKLRMHNLIIQVVSYGRYGHDGYEPYKSKYARQNKRVRQNDREFYKIPNNKKSELLFYGKDFRINTIRRDNTEIRFSDRADIYEFKTLQYEDLGLGIFDQYDYFIKKNGKTSDYNF
jgi:hypothetical protein